MILLVVDVQRALMDEHLFGFDAFKRNVGEIIRAARESGVEVIFVRHDGGAGSVLAVGSAGFEIYDEFEPRAEERIFDKNVNSALHPSTGLAEYLAAKSEKQLMIVGLQTDFCIDATIKTGFDSGYEMIAPEYANSTFPNRFMSAEAAYRYFNEMIWPDRYAKRVSMPDAIAMLRGNYK